MAGSRPDDYNTRRFFDGSRSETFFVTDWCNTRLGRNSKSSLTTEAQAASACVDSIEWVKTCLALAENSDLDTSIEVMVMKERMQASNTVWRWLSSERQLTDGLTSVGSRAAH